MECRNIDEQLLQRVQRKDRDALEMLYSRYERLLFLAAYRITLDEAKAEEVLIELFTDLWTYPYSFSAAGDVRFSAVILQKCMAKCRRYYKSDRTKMSAAVRA